MVLQPCGYTKDNEIIYPVNTWTLWYVNYISKKKEEEKTVTEMLKTGSQCIDQCNTLC